MFNSHKRPSITYKFFFIFLSYLSSFYCRNRSYCYNHWSKSHRVWSSGLKFLPEAMTRSLALKRHWLSWFANVSVIKKRIVGMGSSRKDDKRRERGHQSRWDGGVLRGPVTFSSPRDPTSCHPLVTSRLHAAGASSSLRNAKYRRRAARLFIEPTRSIDTRYRIERATERVGRGGGGRKEEKEKYGKLRLWIKNKEERERQGERKERKKKRNEEERNADKWRRKNGSKKKFYS